MANSSTGDRFTETPEKRRRGSTKLHKDTKET